MVFSVFLKNICQLLFDEPKFIVLYDASIVSPTFIMSPAAVILSVFFEVKRRKKCISASFAADKEGDSGSSRSLTSPHKALYIPHRFHMAKLQNISSQKQQHILSSFIFFSFYLLTFIFCLE